MKACAGEIGWETSNMEIYFFIALVFSVPEFSVEWGHGHKCPNTWVFFFSYYTFPLPLPYPHPFAKLATATSRSVLCPSGVWS